MHDLLESYCSFIIQICIQLLNMTENICDIYCAEEAWVTVNETYNPKWHYDFNDHAMLYIY